MQPAKICILDSRVPLKAPLGDILMAASEGELKLYAVADGWQAANGETLEGWVKLDAADILKSLNCDHIMISKVHQAGRTYKFDQPHKVFMGAIYTDNTELADSAPKAAQPTPKPGPDTDELISTKEAAKLLNCAANTLEKWRSQGSDGPPFYRVKGRTIRYKRAEVRRWAEKHNF